MREASVSLGDEGLDAMGIGELLGLSRERGIREFTELACHGNGAVVQIELDAPYDEHRLRSLDCVDTWEYVAETDGGHLYVIAFTAPELTEAVTEQAEDLVGTCDPKIEDSGGTVSLVGPQESIAGTIREYESAGASPDLRKLTPYEGPDDPTDKLTDRQEEVIRTAFEMGYYDVPRTVSTAEVAATLGLDDSTVAEHLQRAERNLLSQLFE
ncbi:MAG: hypothetical protein ACI8TL_001106 [Natronomonas sp.]|jgi:hypothetical protein